MNIDNHLENAGLKCSGTNPDTGLVEINNR